ncbi:MAG: NAD(P)H-quinone oxidoreductase subunit L [Merismopedia sp. SIO2A8]|nr:NAD(P)H-quinone oxidoreductase subunit L [Symploca sp. SIO2B6]NET52674.1 NAD(P)H-quinone oxidoreductase subunit L [Merismopedia sp. SIO2A8]
MDFSLNTLLSTDPDVLITVLLYLVLGGSYLIVFPILTLLYLNRRWYVASSVERLFMYFAVFLFFPGLLLLSPLINYRPQRSASN